MGLTNPGHIGADVCHLNLHKTFAMPHGGGGPGVGPICVAEHLKPFLPSHPIVATGGDEGITAVASAPFGSALLLPITYGYIKMLGESGLRRATEMAIVNANYMSAALKPEFRTYYSGEICYLCSRERFRHRTDTYYYKVRTNLYTIHELATCYRNITFIESSINFV